jgi:hypothetical protein
MTKCKFEDTIDNYLLNNLAEAEKEEFEEHYFNCSQCFEKVVARNEMIQVIKAKGAKIFRDEYVAAEVKGTAWLEKVWSFFTPRQWAAAAAAAALVAVVVFGVFPRYRGTPLQFYINEEDTVRGGSITLISPIIDIKSVPSYFEWKKLGDDLEYKISIYNQKLLWSASTKENRISLPEEVKKIMIAGEKYSWQVKAFSPKGTLIAVSSKVQFKFSKTE